MVGIFFTKDTKRKFDGRSAESQEQAEELLKSFEEGLRQYKAGKKSHKKEVEDEFEEEESDEEDDVEINEDDDDDDSDKKSCGCGPHEDREKVGQHLICKHGTCLCGWQDDGIRHLGKLFGAEVFAKTTDKDKLEKIKKFLKGKSK